MSSAGIQGLLLDAGTLVLMRRHTILVLDKLGVGKVKGLEGRLALVGLVIILSGCEPEYRVGIRVCLPLGATALELLFVTILDDHAGLDIWDRKGLCL